LDLAKKALTILVRDDRSLSGGLSVCLPYLSAVHAGQKAPVGAGEGGELKRASPKLTGMVDQTYLGTLRPPSRATQHVVASIVGVVETTRFFVDAKGRLAAVFLLDLVRVGRYRRVWTDGLSGGYRVPTLRPGITAPVNG
jgi:hypothetical protein